VTASGRADLEFGTDGTVAAVTVSVGQRVRAGQVLARLDRAGLRSTVRQARADLAAARAQLETDRDAQADTVSDAATSTTPSTAPSASTSNSSGPSDGGSDGAGTTTPDPALAQALAGLAGQQQAVTHAQTAASTALTAAKTALAAQIDACTGADTEPSDGASSEPSSEPSSESSDDDSVPDACGAALTAVQDAQDDVADAQDTLQAALGDLAETLTDAVATLQQSDPSTGSSGSSGSSEEPSTPSTPASPSSPSTSPDPSAQTVTAGTLARDQATIDQARADLVAARQSLRAAVVRAPHTGRVASVAVTEGDQVAAGDAALIVIAPGTTEVEIDVTDTQLRRLDLGQRASARPAGAAKALAGTVTEIGAVPDTSSGSTTYPVTVTVKRRDLSLPSGGTAAVDVVVATAHQVLTVPASAVRADSVTVLHDGATTTTRVTTGLVGTTRIEVTDGLSAGDRVVIADLSTDVPTDDAAFGPMRDGGFPRVVETVP
jgi:multidrug resistance efflux pump